MQLSTRLLCIGVLAVAPLAHVCAASVGLCESAGLTANNGKEMYGPEGRLLTLAVADEPLPADCVSVELPIAAEAVRWFTLTDIPPRGAPDRLALQGHFDAGEVLVSEVIHAQAELQAEPGFIPFSVDMYPHLQVRAFGVEERALPDGRRLDCAAGAQVAGITLRSALLWESLPGMALEITATGSGEFPLAIADARREASEQPQFLGSLQLDGDATTARYPLPENAERWSSLVFFCPDTAAAFVIESLRLVPLERAVKNGRATWLWSPELWRSSPATAWTIAQQENLSTFFITVPVTANGAVAEPERLAAFIREAQARGIAIWAVAGDRGDVLPEQLPSLLARAEGYRRFNAEHPQTPLAGFQLDIEPYLLPGITLAPDYWRDRYIATVTAVHRQLDGQLPLDLVMPVWWGSHTAWGSRLLEALVLPGLSLTVMNYRTGVDALRAGAMPFLAWGQAHARKISMALEKGRIGVNAGNGRDETRVDYLAVADAGELWMVELDGMTALLLLDNAYAALPGQAYAKAGERVISTRAISFAGDPDNLRAVAAMLEAEWSAWDAFAGLAIHGLDQVETQAGQE